MTKQKSKLDPLCRVCKSPFKDPLVYCMYGSVAEFSKSYVKVAAISESFIHLGVHTSDSSCKGNVDRLLANSKGDTQEDLSFCSFDCLRHFFNDCIDEVEKKYLEEFGED